MIVDCIAKFLLTSEISLGGLNGYMTEQELNLLKLTASFMAKARTGSPEIVRSNAFKLALQRH